MINNIKLLYSCLIYCRKLNIKTQRFESENNFCIENIPWLQRVVDYKQAY